MTLFSQWNGPGSLPFVVYGRLSDKPGAESPAGLVKCRFLSLGVSESPRILSWQSIVWEPQDQVKAQPLRARDFRFSEPLFPHIPKEVAPILWCCCED